MSFIINPDAPSGGGGGKRRPEARAGKKLLWAASIEYGKSNAGNDKIDVRWVVVDDPDGGTDTTAFVWDTFTLTEKAAWRLQNLARALEQRTSWDASDEDATWGIVSRVPVWAELVADTYNGKTRMKVNSYTVFGGEVTDEMEAMVNEAEAWCRAGKAKNAGRSGGSAAAGVAQDEDIPF